MNAHRCQPMKAKNPAILTKPIKMEIEQQYPYVLALKSQLQIGISATSPDRIKQTIVNVLKQTESFMSAEVSKLRNKPNRATKYAAYMRRLIGQLKLCLNWMVEADELIAYPILGLIITHYLNILLASSMKTRFPPMCVASQAYGFAKVVFDSDIEYVLDTVICSDVSDDAAEVNSVGYHIFCQILQDQYLYLQDAPTFAKFCAISALLKDSKAGETLVNNTFKDLTVFPGDLEEHLKRKYNFPKLKKFNLSAVIDNIKPRLVSKAIRKERLIVDLHKIDTTDEDQENETHSHGIMSEQAGSSGSNMFFFDLKGNYETKPPDSGSEEVTSTFQSYAYENQNFLESDYEPQLSENENEAEREMDSESEHSANLCEEEEFEDDDDDDEDLESNPDDPGNKVPFEEMYDRREPSSTGTMIAEDLMADSKKSYTPADEETEYCSDDDDYEEYQANTSDNQIIVSEDEKSKSDSESNAGKSDITTHYQEKNKARKTPSPPKKSYVIEESDSDLEVVEVLCSGPSNQITGTNIDENEEEERDLADPESGEDEVPEYSEKDYLYNRDDESADESELLDNKEESVVQNLPKMESVVKGVQENDKGSAQIDSKSEEPVKEMESNCSVRRSSRLKEKVPEKRNKNVPHGILDEDGAPKKISEDPGTENTPAVSIDDSKNCVKAEEDDGNKTKTEKKTRRNSKIESNSESSQGERVRRSSRRLAEKAPEKRNNNVSLGVLDEDSVPKKIKKAP